MQYNMPKVIENIHRLYNIDSSSMNYTLNIRYDTFKNRILTIHEIYKRQYNK